jgi:hypothetical protein
MYVFRMCRNVRSENINSVCINKEPVAHLPVYKGRDVHTYTKWHFTYYITFVVSCVRFEIRKVKSDTQ